MKKIVSLILMACVAIGLNASTLKTSPGEVLNVEINNDSPSVFTFNFFVKTVKPITESKDKIRISMLDKGFTVIPTYKDVSGVLIVTNEKGNSYIINFETGDVNSSKNFKIDDVTYELQKSTEKFNFESNDVDRDISNIVKAISLNKPLSGFESKKLSYSLENKEFKMERKVRHMGKKYVVEEWVFTNITAEKDSGNGYELFFENRNFATDGIIGVSIFPEYLAPGETASGIFVTNKAALLAR